jgi:hypothetical protein
VLAGSIAARLHGSPLLTAVADVVPAVTPANFEALAAALGHLSARLYLPATPAGIAFEVSADSLAAANQWDLVTTCGRLRVWFRPPGVAGFDELASEAVRFALHGDEVRVASLRHLLRMHEAPQAAEATAQATVLRSLLARAAD